jgi:hypothetical protein
MNIGKYLECPGCKLLCEIVNYQKRAIHPAPHCGWWKERLEEYENAIQQARQAKA